MTPCISEPLHVSTKRCKILNKILWRIYWNISRKLFLLVPCRIPLNNRHIPFRNIKKNTYIAKFFENLIISSCSSLFCNSDNVICSNTSFKLSLILFFSHKNWLILDVNTLFLTIMWQSRLNCFIFFQNKCRITYPLKQKKNRLLY